MKFALMACLLVMVACSSHKTYNQESVGKIAIIGGVSKNISWDDQMVMKRMSWYHGITLYYDALLWKADINSPFINWFSAYEKEFFSKCQSFVVAAEYSFDPMKISLLDFKEQMRLNGYDDVVLNTFAPSFKNHPSANEWHLQGYKVRGYCKRSASSFSAGKLNVNFPSFKQLEIDL